MDVSEGAVYQFCGVRGQTALTRMMMAFGVYLLDSGASCVASVAVWVAARSCTVSSPRLMIHDQQLHFFRAAEYTRRYLHSHSLIGYRYALPHPARPALSGYRHGQWSPNSRDVLHPPSCREAASWMCTSFSRRLHVDIYCRDSGGIAGIFMFFAKRSRRGDGQRCRSD